MKKLLNGKFLIIIAVSLVMLIALGIGAIYLFDDSDDVFVKSGYVLNPLSSKVEKYFFDENTTYRENLSQLIEFSDVDNNDTNVAKDSFLHYLDGSLSFLKNGAIMDLDSINSSEAVNFYNITSKSIIEKDNNNYVIANGNNDIVLNNFIGRISDDKYIVVGDLSLKLDGNAKRIDGEYFEIVYLEEGIVNIENKDIKYQVAAEGTMIYVDDNIVINLGDKKIVSNDKDVMSITAITIDGNENIEIIPSNKSEDESNGAGTTGDDGDETTGNNDNSNGNNENTADEGNDELGNGEENGGNGTVDGNDSDSKIVSLKDATVGSTKIEVTFDIYNQQDSDVFTLKVTNLDTGRTVDMITTVVCDELISVNLLSPNTRYLFTVINEADNGKYFQKIFETNGFGIELERSYATDSELAYKVSIDDESDVTSAKLTLYKYNEELKKNEVVTSSYYDNESGEIKTIQKVSYISNLDKSSDGTYEIVYDGLDSDTIYTAVLDDFSIVSANFKDIYNITLTSMTLKKSPTFSNMTVSKDYGAGSFKLSLGNIDDEDNAIISYTYLIYEKDNADKTVIDPISKTNASPIEISIGDGEGQLKNDTNYFYKVIIEYFDNEKYIEYVDTDSINFMMESTPYITVVPNEDNISYDKIGATIYLTDNSCLINVSNRDGCDGTSTTVIDVKKVNSLTGDTVSVYTKLVDFTVDENGVKYDLVLDKLQSGTTYSIDVRADLNNTDEVENDYLLHTDDSKRTISTKTLMNFITDWKDLNSSASHVINLQSKFVAEEGTGTLNASDSASAIKKVVLQLYNGKDIEDLQLQEPIAEASFVNSDTFNIKENFYDSGYTITSDGTFGLDIDALRELSSDGRLSEYYTVMIYAYYDQYENNQVQLSNNVIAYKVNPVLLLENISDPKLEIEYISNKESGISYNLNNDGTRVGYKVTAAFDWLELYNSNLNPLSINWYVYDANGEKVSFYIKDSDGNLKLVDKDVTDIKNDKSGYYTNEIYIGYGTDYDNVDSVMSRGNSYYIGFDVEVGFDNKTTTFPTRKSKPADSGVYKLIETEKETPNIKMYIAKSTKDSITYRYEVSDPDHALYKESETSDYGFYYTLEDDDTANKLVIKKTDDDNNVYSGDITINGLSNGMLYSLYYKKNITKTGNIDDDVVNYLDGDDSGIRMFDGYYDVTDSKYNFKYEVINNSLSDNEVSIKILASSEMLDRILSYRVHFEDSLGNVLDKELWELSACSSGDEINRCLSVDYIELKNAGMKSDKTENNMIKVTVDVVYDTGLTGYDFVVGDNGSYPYMIMQNNSTASGLGSYLAINSSGKLVVWGKHLGTAVGYYNYSFDGKLMKYVNKLNSKAFSIAYSLTSTGYMASSYGTMNPKMLAVASMGCDNNTFSFNSITPKIKVSVKSQLINGAVVNLSLSGADLESDFKNEGTEKDPKYYLYIDVWANEEDAINEFNYNRMRTTVKVELNMTKSGDSVLVDSADAIIDELPAGRTYYFNVYAMLYKGGSDAEYTQLFDADVTDDYVSKSYSFKAWDRTDLFNRYDVSYVNSEDNYGDRELNTTISLKSYASAYPYNFGLVYVFCSEYSNCGLGEDDSYIFKKEISVDDISSKIVSSEDISKYNLEFGDKNYFIMIYAVYDAYDVTSSTVITDYLLLNMSATVKLKALTEPSFVVSRSASIVNNGNDKDYVIDFDITVNDPDKTLVGKIEDGSDVSDDDKNELGKYYIRLKDSTGKVVGILQELDEDGNYYDVAKNIGDYEDYAFDATVINKRIRIRGLDADTKYTIEVYSNAYVNNYSESISLEERTYKIEKSHTVYSVNDYGVAFGRDVLFSATEKSIVVTFLGGSSFDNVLEVYYTIGLWDDNENTSTISGTYVVGENNKRFEKDVSTQDWKFVIDPEGMKNTLGQTYTVGISFKVATTDNNYVILTSADNSSFSGRTQYVQDENKS